MTGDAPRRGLTADRWARIGDWLDQVLAADPADRERRATELAGDDDEARRELLSLIRADARHGATLDRALEEGVRYFVPAPEEEEGPDPWIGRVVGDYRLVRRIGVGGMGAVYEAERADARFDRTAAVKLVRGGPGQAELRERFNRERRILAGLEHPNVARLLDAGVAGEGVPYFVMEHVQGVPIDRFCADRGLAVEERIRLFLQVCDAVRYAHQRLVIHRDIKPANVLVHRDGSVKLLDFGVAKLLSETDGDATITGTGRPLTPAYASPEQLRGDPVSTASDVYSLGVLLYELLTGRRPVVVEPTPVSIARSLETTPPPPSVAVEEEAWGQDTNRVRRVLSGDLDHILLMALRKEPERRYDSADRLADDLRRWLAHKPVRARPDTLGYRARKFARRNRVPLMASAAVALALVGGITATSVQARRATRAAATAERERANAEAASAFLERMIWTASPGWATPGERVGPDLTIADLLESMERSVGAELADRPRIQGRIRRMLGIAYFYMGRYPEAARQAETAYRLDRSVHGELHYDVAHDLEILADAEQQYGHFDAAREHYERAIAIFRRTVTGPDTLLFFTATLNNYGAALRTVGEHERALTLLEEARDRSRRDLGPGHPMEAVVEGNLGLVARDRGELDRATDHLQRALDIWADVPGRRRFEEAMVRARLGDVEVRRGRLDAADSLLVAARDVLDRTPGTFHTFAHTVWTGLARLHEARGELDRAETAARRALTGLEGTVHPDHPDVAEAEILLGRVLLTQSLPEPAAPLLHHAARVLSDLLPGNAPLLGEARDALARLTSAAQDR